MKRRILCLLIASLHLMSWVFATSCPCKAVHEQETGSILHSPQVVFESKQGLEESMPRRALHEKEEAYKGLSRLGSRPPNCEHKCGGCKPCSAIQVPTTTDHLGVQYANYEPEGWKCKCGTSFFDP
ncbi:MEPFL3 like [Actinidia chinensis var. chinensis]|uniref:Epidermal patterning factor-like protein n=1 Tax=Actinidia chinensis var. chinensis TaxID=1590841 RepID=A0A2R6R468_ACTCC|nr:MEPFL3 like [Actinidia chinensis var. chinensis]